MSTAEIIEPPNPSRDALRAHHLAPETTVLREALAIVGLDEAARARVRDRATALADSARQRAAHDGFALSLIHRFGLNTPHGIALMQLAEALPRTVSRENAYALIADKIGLLSWRDAVGEASGFAERLALHALDILSKAFREARPGSAIQSLGLKGLQKAIAVLGRQYVLGETLAAAERNGRRLARKGYRFSYDMLGEAAQTNAAAEAFHASYAQAIEFLRGRDGERYAISVKLSALHPRFEERERSVALPVLYGRVQDLARRARDARLRMTIDAEESDRLEFTLDVFEQLLADPELQGYDGLGIAVQAYQRRALSLVDYLAALARHSSTRVHVRLVKGAYWDTEIKRAQQLGLTDYPIFIRKCDTDVNYLACARRLLGEPKLFAPQFATHNAHTLAAVIELARQNGNVNFEFQRLHGMGEHLHSALLQAGYQSRIYAPIGPQRELLPYLVRRLLENGASSSFVRQLSDPNIPLDKLTRDPMQIAATSTLARSGVAKPRVVFNQNWPSARGHDLTMRTEAEAVAKIVRKDVTPHAIGPVINGAVLTTDAPANVTNPANRAEVIGRVADATSAQVTEAITAAQAAFATWAATLASERAAILERAARLLEERSAEFIRLAVREAGKTLDDAIGEVREAADFCRYYASQSQTAAFDAREPLGVIACISPWNFPLAIFLGQITGALAAGNSVVAKPAEQTPLIAAAAIRLLHDAGVPAAAVNLVTGDGRIGSTLVGDSRIAGVCFTGSTFTARAIAQTLASTQRGAIPFIAETGGINAMLIDCTALPEQAVRDVLTSAFQSAGQRCSALRLLCLQNEVAERILSLLAGALEQLRVGDPAELITDVGPLIDAEAQTNVLDYVRSRKPIKTAAVDADCLRRGTYAVPSILEVARVSDVEREVFGPVLHVMRYGANELEEVIGEINRLGFGLTLGVHTRIQQRAQTIVRLARVGNVYVNRHQVGAVVGQQPFGGHGLSGTGPKAGGPHYLLRLSRKPRQAVGSNARIQITDAPVEPRVRAAFAQVRAAQSIWEANPQRVERIQFARDLLAANTSHPLSAAAASVHLPDAIELNPPLANIAGEKNTLRLLPRGVLLCLSPHPELVDAAVAQILRGIALGNGIVVAVNNEAASQLRELIAELQQSGVPDGLIACLELQNARIPASWLNELEFDGLVFDGNDECKHELAARLLDRRGALLPLLSSRDDSYRFGLEQTVTVNTAAAGGDPTLLALSG